jgi:hypothetical protein
MLVDHQHDFCGLYDGCDLISHLDVKVYYALPGDDTLDEVFPHAHTHLRRDHSKINRFYLASQLITRRYFHACDCMYSVR